jgi:hypothetical protein
MNSDENDVEMDTNDNACEVNVEWAGKESDIDVEELIMDSEEEAVNASNDEVEQASNDSFPLRKLKLKCRVDVKNISKELEEAIAQSMTATATVGEVIDLCSESSKTSILAKSEKSVEVVGEVLRNVESASISDQPSFWEETSEAGAGLEWSRPRLELQPNKMTWWLETVRMADV